MRRLNPFRVSFDGPIGSRERMRARVTATVVGGAVLFLGTTSLLALLNASSEAIGTWSNGKPEPEVRIVAGDAPDPSGKACEDQTWPYIESHCLKRVDPKTTERSTPKHGLGSEQVVLPIGPLAAAPTPKPNAVPERATTGAAPPADDPPPADAAVVPIPVPAPAMAAQALAEAPEPALNGDTARHPRDANPPPLSLREQRRGQREERMRAQRERRLDARRARAERQRAKAEARNNARQARQDQRIVRRWTEYTYASPSGRGQRVIVIRRGSLDDDFFRTIR